MLRFARKKSVLQTSRAFPQRFALELEIFLCPSYDGRIRTRGFPAITGLDGHTGDPN